MNCKNKNIERSKEIIKKVARLWSEYNNVNVIIYINNSGELNFCEENEWENIKKNNNKILIEKIKNV